MMLATIVPTSALGIAGIWGLFGAVILGLVKALPALKKIQSDGDASLREDLLDRIKTLETRVDSVSSQGVAREEIHAAEIAVLRHRLNGESATVDALISLLEGNPNFPPETLKRITDSRARQLDQFNTEMNTITAHRLNLTAKSASKE